MDFRRIVIATHNIKKGREMMTILARNLPKVDWLTLSNFPNAPEPEETGNTYKENAVIKAESAARFCQYTALADDAGLEIDFLNGEPGVRSKRFAGEASPFDEKMRLILDAMKDAHEQARSARFRCYVAIASPDKGTQTEVFEAVCEGRIATEISGSGGFGYDPIFYLPELGCTMADLTAEEKHSISHRGKILAKVSDFIAEHLSIRH